MTILSPQYDHDRRSFHRSVTLVGEADRKMLKSAIKHSAGADHVRHRLVPTEAVSKCARELDRLKDEVSAILQEEKEEKQVTPSTACCASISQLVCIQLRQAEMELTKGENLIKHQEEIHSRPARTWFQNTKEKNAAKGMLFLQAGLCKLTPALLIAASKLGYEAVSASQSVAKPVQQVKEAKVKKPLFFVPLPLPGTFVAQKRQICRSFS